MLEIVVEDDVYITEDRGYVDTRIYIECNGICFPSNTWTDLTFPILEVWKNVLLKVRNSCDISFEFVFFEGSFFLEIYKGQNMDLKVDFVNERMRKKVELTLHCGYYELLSAIYNALKTFAKILYKNNMHTGGYSSIYQQTILSINEIKVILK